MMHEKLDIPLRIKEITESGEFSGYGSVFGVKDSQDDIVVKGAFEESLENWSKKGRLPAMLWQHKTDEPIGAYTLMKEDTDGLYFEGRLLVEADPVAKRAHAHLKAGSISGMSIGYQLNEDGYEYNKEKEAFILSKIDLWELSIVTFPSNDDARVQQVKRGFSEADIPAPKLVERYLRDVMSVQQAKAFMAEGYSGISLRDVGIDAECKKAARSIIERLRN